ncbi:YndJ family protein [Alkalihalobacillus deserti]|uniref:YndJ family protein n=1 Tax=Alkalihalobacillus deserti TaxID=2879466 RepID=UPI001D15E19B|nr:YndJ family protein [Alkalihalobacillus deserti]
MKKIITVQASLGLLFWLISFYFLDVPQIERLLLFAMLVILPLTLYLTETKDRKGNYFKTYLLSVYLYPVAALLAFISFFFPIGITAGILSIAWLLWTSLVFLYGLFRLLARGIYFIEEISIDIGLMYLVLGGVWFSIFQFGFDVMEFGSIIILLTAIHFHFSAFITPIFVGLLGRVLRHCDGHLHIIYRIIAIGVMVSSLGIAIGITFSRLIEFIFVVVFVICLWAYAYFTIVTIRKDLLNKFAYVLLVFSSGTLVFTMVLAFYYGLGRLLHIELISIPDMVWLHGIGNAFGFVFLGVIGWFLINPKMYFNPYGIPYSNYYGQWRIGADFFQDHVLHEEHSVPYHGLVDNLNTFQQKGFEKNEVHPDIRNFYENTLEYQLLSKTYWHRGFRGLSRLYKIFSSKIEQINLPLNNEDGELVVDSKIIALDSNKDGRRKVRAWIRTSRKTKKAVFVAAYSYHEHDKKVYLNIALPLPFGQMTGVLRFENPHMGNKRNGLILTSLEKRDDKGDEGIYYVTKWFTIRLPLNERFIVWVPASTPNKIKASHEMWMLGIKFLSIDYSIEKTES